MRRVFILIAQLTLFSLLGRGQVVERVPARLVMYPEMIIHNAKIVTMDDPSFNSTPGTIAQAMAIREGKILAIGSNEELLGLAGPQTKVIDLKGRTVLPGLITTHDHLQEYAFSHQAVFETTVPQDVVVSRWVKGDSIEEIIRNFEPALREAVGRAKPGQWIRIELFRGIEDQFRIQLTGLLGKENQPINKSLLDRIAPNNPVAVKSGISMLINQKAIEELRARKVYEFDEVVLKKGLGGTELYRAVETDGIMGGRVELLAELYRGEMAWWAGYGITTVTSHVMGYESLGAFRLLDKRGELPLRFAWGYRQVPLRLDDLGLRRLSDLVGTGSDYMWLIGIHSDIGGSCTTAPAAPEVKRAETCNFAPGTRGREDLERIIRAGGRIATMHTEGDKDIDYYLDAIEQASQEGGFALDEIRAKRHSFDHCELAPRPDQIPRIKKLGIIVSCLSGYLWEEKVERQDRQYGRQVTDRLVPRKSLTSSGIMNTFEIDRPIGHTVRTPFFYLYLAMSRKSRAGNVHGPQERVDRAIALKSATIWGSYYVLREDKLGSLEPGKFADFFVIDRDYFTIPEEEIPKIKVLMTTIGGRIKHLVPELAAELKMEPVGLQVKLARVP